jgi:hypothetical protein
VLLSQRQFGRLLSFLSNPYGFVASLISVYIVGVVFDVASILIGSVLYAFDIIAGSFGYAQRTLVVGFSTVGIDILGALVGVQQAVSGVVASAGPLGPPLAVAAASLSLYVLYRLGIAALGELPVGSTVVDLLRLR